jgi:hypothetical protein
MGEAPLVTEAAQQTPVAHRAANLHQTPAETPLTVVDRVTSRRDFSSTD